MLSIKIDFLQMFIFLNVVFQMLNNRLLLEKELAVIFAKWKNARRERKVPRKLNLVLEIC